MKVLASYLLSISSSRPILSTVHRKGLTFSSRFFQNRNASNDVSTPTHFIETSKVYNCESTWAIQNFRLLHGGFLITGKPFSPKDIKYEWFLEMYNGKGNSWHGSSLDLVLKPSDEAIKKFGGASGEVKFALIDAEGEKKSIKTKPFIVRTTDNPVRFDEFIKQDDLFDACDTRSLLPGGTLTIYCQVSFIIRDEIDTIVVENRFSRYFNNEESSDLTIKLPWKEYPAHKFVLAARSPVFKEMFERDTVENHHRDSIVIRDIDEDVFLEMLRFIYTDKVDKEKVKDTKFKFNLLLAANKYNIEELKTICEKEILDNMTKSVDMAEETYMLSLVHNLEELKTKAAKYFEENDRVDLERFYSYTLFNIRSRVCGNSKITRAFQLLLRVKECGHERLKEMIEIEISKMLSNEAAVEILLSAEKHNFEYLKEKSIEYIKENVEKVMKSDRWNELTSHPLMVDLVKDRRLLNHRERD